MKFHALWQKELDREREAYSEPFWTQMVSYFYGHHIMQSTYTSQWKVRTKKLLLWWTEQLHVHCTPTYPFNWLFIITDSQSSGWCRNAKQWKWNRQVSVTSCTLPLVALQTIWFKPWLKNKEWAGVALSNQPLTNRLKGQLCNSDNFKQRNDQFAVGKDTSETSCEILPTFKVLIA